MGDAELDQEEDSYADDWSEDETPADDWGEDEGPADDWEDEYDGQDQIPFTPPHASKLIDEPLVPDPNSTDDGNSRVLRPVRAKAQHKAWICEYCHAINNLLESMKRQYKCISCAGKYRPGQALIEAKEEDKHELQKKQWKVWLCECSKVNQTDWIRCDLCNKPQPTEGVMSFWSDEQPTGTGAMAIWSEVYRRPVYHGNLSLLNVQPVDAYPKLKDMKTMTQRLLSVFGAPYRIKTSQNNKWSDKHAVGDCVMTTAGVDIQSG
eukprot:989572_1